MGRDRSCSIRLFCDEPGCVAEAVVGGKCKRHYNQLRYRSVRDGTWKGRPRAEPEPEEEVTPTCEPEEEETEPTPPPSKPKKQEFDTDTLFAAAVVRSLQKVKLPYTGSMALALQKVLPKELWKTYCRGSWKLMEGGFVRTALVPTELFSKIPCDPALYARLSDAVRCGDGRGRLESLVPCSTVDGVPAGDGSGDPGNLEGEEPETDEEASAEDPDDDDDSED
jgi:hypothetical protein